MANDGAEAPKTCGECRAPAPDHRRDCTRGTSKPEAPDYLANFAQHLKARMRALGLQGGQLAERVGVNPMVISKAANGNGAGLDVAPKIAREVGSHLPAMLGAYSCSTCEGTPPAGFTCQECQAEGERL